MKRILSLILVCSLLLSGCGFFGERIKEPVTFYYLCSNYQEDLCCVIASEQREASGHSGDLPYLLALYSMGPTSDGLVSPLPTGSRITSAREDSQVRLDLGISVETMSDIEFSLACACLTLTCLEISDAEEVSIQCVDRVRTLDRASLTLYDSTAETTPMEETQ